MANNAPTRLRINPEFNLMVAPLSEAERIAKEHATIRRSKSVPIAVWGDVILVDYEAYIFCRSRKLPLDTVQAPVKSKEEAIVWIVKNQLPRTDLTEELRKYLIGKRCNAEKVLGAMEAASHKRAAKSMVEDEAPILPPALYESTATRTCERLGAEYHISFGTVRKYGIYASMLDQLTPHEPAFVKMILNGTIRMSHENLVEICNMSRGELNKLSKYFFNGVEPNPTYLKYKALTYDDKPRASQVAPPAGSIKEIPQYDPDAEVASLALTVPSWTDSVKRARKNTDFTKISEQARWRLVYELDQLTYTIDGLMATLKEEHNG